MSDGKRVLVTGAGGYIGTVLTPMLLEAGYAVRALDRFFFGRELLADHDRLEVVVEDNRRLTAAHFEGVETVIDLAALSNDPTGELFQEATRQINCAARVNAARLAKQAGAKRYVLPSSCSIYGFQQHDAPAADETSPTNPLTTYARANEEAEQGALALADDQFCVVALRQATVYGISPRMRFDLAINGMTYGAWKTGKLPVMRDGSQWRPMVHVRDAAAAQLFMLEADSARVNGQIFNVGSAADTCQIRPLAELIAEQVRSPHSEPGRHRMVRRSGSAQLPGELRQNRGPGLARREYCRRWRGGNLRGAESRAHRQDSRDPHLGMVSGADPLAWHRAQGRNARGHPRNMKVILLGPKGQLGRDITRAHEQAGEPFTLLPLPRDQLDLAAPEKPAQVLDGMEFDALVNCAACHNTDEVEDNANPAFAVNARAVGVLAKVCAKRGARFIHISTDYVFGGDRGRAQPLREDDPIAPVNVYGASKALGRKPGAAGRRRCRHSAGGVAVRRGGGQRQGRQFRRDHDPPGAGEGGLAGRG